MTKEKLEILVNSWNGLGLGTNGGDVVPKLQSTHSNTLITSVLQSLFIYTHIESPLVRCNESTTSSETYLDTSEMRIIWEAMLRLNWMRSSPPSPIAK